MSFRARLVIAALVVAWVPVLSLGLLVRSVGVGRLEEANDLRMNERGDALAAGWREDVTELENRLDGLARLLRSENEVRAALRTGRGSALLDAVTGVASAGGVGVVGVLDPDGTNRVAVGIVPWNQEVHLDSATASEWSSKGWARYPAKRTYPVPYISDLGTPIVNPVVDTLPVSPPQPWKGCFDEHRIRLGVASLPAPTETALFEPPSAAPFAQSYFTPRNGFSYRCRDASETPANTFNSCLEGDPDRAQDICKPNSNRSLAPLSTDRTAIESKVNGIFPTAAGTRSALGVLWAQRMLEPAWKSVWGGSGIHPADPKGTGFANL